MEETGKTMNQKQPTKKRIAELQGAVDKLKEEEADLKVRLGKAESDLWDAQHEVKRHAKPTPAMLVILRLIASDEAIHRNRYSYSFYTHDANGRNVKVRDSVFYGLLEREVITRVGTSKDEWRINDHGQAVLNLYSQKQEVAQ